MNSSTRYGPLCDNGSTGNISRPLNAFFIFSNMHRQELRQRLPHLNNTEISKHLGELWAKMTPEYKAMYFEEAERIKHETERHHHDDVQPCCGRGNVRVSIKAVPKEDLEQEIKFGGYVPPFHIFSAKMKRLNKMKREKSQRRGIGSLSDYRTFMDDRSPTDPVMSRKTYEHSSKDLTSMSSLGNRDYHIQECDRAVANITTSAGDNIGPYHSLHDNFQRDCHGKTCVSYPPNQNRYPDAEYYPSSHSEYYHNTQYNTASQDRHQRFETIESPQQGQDQVMSERYGVVQTSQSLEGEEETNYVLVPCDVSVAKMLGWPVHMLQKVSKSMLDRFKAQSRADPLTMESGSSMEIQTALVSSSDIITAPSENAPSPLTDAVLNRIQQSDLQATMSANSNYTVLPSETVPGQAFVIHRDQTLLDQMQQAKQTNQLPKPKSNSHTYTTTTELQAAAIPSETDMKGNISKDGSTSNLLKQSLNVVSFDNTVVTNPNGREGDTIPDMQLSSVPANTNFVVQADMLHTAAPSSMHSQVVHTDNMMTKSECSADIVNETESTTNLVQETYSTADLVGGSESTVNNIVAPFEPTAMLNQMELTSSSVQQQESTTDAINQDESNLTAAPFEPTAMLNQTELNSTSVLKQESTADAINQDESNLIAAIKPDITSDKAIQAEFSADKQQ